MTTPGEQHRRERQGDRDQRQPDQLQADGRQPPQRERRQQPGGERAERDDEREGDHGANR